MPRPSKNYIHDPIYQIKDFFRDNDMRREIPRNPYNIQWMIENIFISKYPEEKEHLMNILEICKLSIQENTTIIYQRTFIPSWFFSEILSDENVILRVKNLQKAHDLNLDFLACKAVRMKSDILYLSLLDLGMNPNAEDKKNHNIPIQIAFNRKCFKIAKALFLHPKFDRYQKTFHQQKSIPMLAIQTHAWQLLEFIFEKEPLLFLEKDKDNKTILPYIENINGGYFLFQKTKNSIKVPEKMKTSFVKIFDFMEKNNIAIHKGKNEDLNKIIIHHNFDSLQSILDNQKNSLYEKTISSSNFKL